MPLPDVIRTQRDLLSTFRAAAKKRAEAEAAANKQHLEAQAAAKKTREQEEAAALKKKNTAFADMDEKTRAALGAVGEVAARLNEVHIPFPSVSVPPQASGVDPEQLFTQTIVKIPALALDLKMAISELQSRRKANARKRKIVLAWGAITLVVLGILAFSLYKDSLYSHAQTAIAAENWDAAAVAAEQLRSVDATRGMELLVEIREAEVLSAIAAENWDAAAVAAEQLRSVDATRGMELLTLSVVAAGKPRPADGMVMVYAPAGEFEMGSTEGGSDEEPVHTVALDGFWLDRTEVTNAQYGKCVTADKCDPSDYSGDSRFNGDDQPVVGVSWHDAVAYCEWAGSRLPTEAQWEYAARGSEGLTYPWGDAWREKVANCDESYCKDRYDYTSPVGSFPQGASWVGALDLAGNVWEWVADSYGDYPSERQVNPTGPSGDYRVLRGGSWGGDGNFVRGAYRDGSTPANTYYGNGFRCGVSAAPGQ
ncbi:MAG: formylglycine-generating enzyme family protein [Anaerolineae bacterium]|jgi:formylglycine-generating enzyme required for sulfatase activity|nr:formylglycine-generating enzyme family protein [Anaerolineae bacterium]